MFFLMFHFGKRSLEKLFPFREKKEKECVGVWGGSHENRTEMRKGEEEVHGGGGRARGGMGNGTDQILPCACMNT